MSGGSAHPLAGFFEPASVAIIGASGNPDKLGGRPLRYFRTFGFQGAVHPVNNAGGTVQGYPAYRSATEIEGPVDQALVIVPAPACLKALEDCAAKGIRLVQVLSSGFGEAGAEGIRMQQELLAFARAHDMRIIGPNCLGIVGVRNRFMGTFSTALEGLDPSPGVVAVATQSGAFGSCAYSMAIQRGLGLSRIVATGNEADVDIAECIDYLAEDDETRVICAAIEGCPDGHRLRRALLKAAARGKPVVIMKVGTTAIGMVAAATHTGSLAGNDAVFEAVFAECGAWRARSIEEMLDIAAYCAAMPAPANALAGIVTVSGGVGVLMADSAEQVGLTLPELPAQVQQRLGALLSFAPLANPFDTTAQVSAVPNGIAAAVEVMLQGTDWSTILVYLAQTPCAPEKFEPLRIELTRLRHEHPDRCLVLVGPSDEGVRRRLESDGFAMFTDPSRAMVAAGAAVTLQQRRRNLPEAFIPPRTRAAPLQVRHEADAKALLARYGIPVLPERVCTSAAEAMRAARELGFPVAAKILSAQIPHRTEIGGVLLGLQDEAAVEQAYTVLMGRATAAAPQAKVDGILIAPMAGEGVETILGVHMDRMFGPMIMFGLGGVAVELYKDVAWASAPLSRERALALVQRVRAARLLQGWRGQPAHDVAALVDAIVKLSHFAAEHAAAIASVDINPFLVRREGAVCLDALISLQAAPA